MCAPPRISDLLPETDTPLDGFILTADTSDSDGTIAKVEFYNGSTLLGTLTTAPYTYVWDNVPAGNYSLTAVATDDQGATTTSSPISITVNTGIAQVYYIHPDQLDTPRQITDTSGNTVWQWDNSDPFGANIPNENPTGQGAFNFNLRFPGQYADRETNTHYNIFRDYDPAIGRYVESDPIGLQGGINTYTYVENNPLIYTDPNGLWKWYGNWGGPNWTGGYEKPYDELTQKEKDSAKPPIDAQDSCYQSHDMCYGQCRDTASCQKDSSNTSSCFNSCDLQLNMCLSKVNKTISPWVGNWHGQKAEIFFYIRGHLPF